MARHWREEGKDPDYRFSLANERTFLAWIRTALALLAAGLLLSEFAPGVSAAPAVYGVSVGLGGLCAVLAAGAYRRWKENERAMRQDQPLPNSALLPMLSAAVILLAVVMTGLLIFA